jgi:hypothetical protein
MKNGAAVCPVRCAAAPPGAADGAGSWASAEPSCWPARLDVKNRTDTRYVCGTLFPGLAPGGRAVLRLRAAAAAAHEKLAEFSRYLRDKGRAGIVALPPVEGGGPRTLYLVPPTPEACRALKAPWPAPGGKGKGEGEWMLALVVQGAPPAAVGGGGGGGGAGK